MNLILSLNGSGSFASTHAIIKELGSVEEWDADECEMLIDIALNNTQVGCCYRVAHHFMPANGWF